MMLCWCCKQTRVATIGEEEEPKSISTSTPPSSRSPSPTPKKESILNKEWNQYREVALDKLPPNLRESYRENWWSLDTDEDSLLYDDEDVGLTDDDRECIPRLVSLVQSNIPKLTVRDLFAICETEVHNVPMEDLNVVMEPYEDEEERLEVVKSLALNVCDMYYKTCKKHDEVMKGYKDEETYMTKEEVYTAIEEMKNQAEAGELSNLDPVFRMLPCTLQYACTNYFTNAFWSGGSIENHNKDCEQNPMLTMLVCLGLATIEPVMSMNG